MWAGERACVFVLLFGWEGVERRVVFVCFFCCLGGACFGLLFRRGRVVFCSLGGGKKHAPAQTAEKTTTEKPKQQQKPDNKKVDTLTYSPCLPTREKQANAKKTFSQKRP